MKKTLLFLTLLAAPIAAEPNITPDMCSPSQYLAWVAHTSATPFLGYRPVFDLNTELACAYKRWGVGFEDHGYMHSVDHQDALLCLYGVEPSYLAVYDSWSAGSANIDAARKKCGTTVDTLLGCLVQLQGAANGSRLYNDIVACKKPIPPACLAAPADPLVKCGQAPPPPPPPGPVCGDAACNGAETWQSCPADCPAPPPTCPAGQSCRAECPIPPPCPACPPPPTCPAVPRCWAINGFEIERARRLCESYSLPKNPKTAACAQYEYLRLHAAAGHAWCEVVPAP